MYQILLIVQNISYSYRYHKFYLYTHLIILIYINTGIYSESVFIFNLFKDQNIYFFSIQKITRIILHLEAPYIVSNLLNFSKTFRNSSSPHTPQFHSPFHPNITQNIPCYALFYAISPSPTAISHSNPHNKLQFYHFLPYTPYINHIPQPIHYITIILWFHKLNSTHHNHSNYNLHKIFTIPSCKSPLLLSHILYFHRF